MACSNAAVAKWLARLRSRLARVAESVGSSKCRWASGSGRADVRGCLGPRYRLEGDAGECQLLASSFGCGTRGWRAFPGARESEMGEDPLNDGRVLDRGDELHPPGTAWTT